jgi:DNA-binding HxlR family transcriptional regulator
LTVEEDPTKALCPNYHAAVELVGKRWVGAILWVLCERPMYFGELAGAVSGVSDRLLSVRLRELERLEIVERHVENGAPARVRYSLTPKGQALKPALREIYAWAGRFEKANVP